jgi:hypothetical protein
MRSVVRSSKIENCGAYIHHRDTESTEVAQRFEISDYKFENAFMSLW